MMRWTIEARVRTVTRLAVGTGAFVDGTVFRSDESSSSPGSQVAGVHLDASGLATIPGASIRGAVRAWVRAHVPAREQYLFGDAARKAGCQAGDVATEAGRLEFRWARSTALVTPPGSHEHDAGWDSAARHAVDVSVALDPTSRAAAEHLLRTYRYVPAGVEFTVRIGARDVVRDDIECVVAALLSLGGLGGSRIALGSKQVSGFGAFALAGAPRDAIRVRRAAPDDVAQWLAAGAPSAGYAIGVPLPASELTQVLEGAGRLASGPSTGNQRVQFDVELKFSERVLVRGLAQGSAARNALRARRDGAGNVMVPGTSFRGVLRAQVARIARTLRQQAPEGSSELICDYATQRGHGCGQRDALGHARPMDKVCVVCALFGATGWRSALHCGDYTVRSPKEAGDPVHQTHVAIDRFTGGAAEEHLYATDSAIGATLRGAIEVDIGRLAKTGRTDEALGLLILALRDLVEGDLSFGLGRSKGFGWCTARIAHVVLPDGVAGAGKLAGLAHLTTWSASGASAEQHVSVQPLLEAARKLATVAPATSPIEATPVAQGMTPVRQVTATEGEFYNPYHFVPAFAPAAGERIGVASDGTLSDASVPGSPSANLSGLTHALYKEGHFSGTVRCRLVAESEVIIGAERNKTDETQPAFVPAFRIDGAPAVPGSALRGMFTSLGEAASNSALRVLEKRALSRRAGMRESLPDVGMMEEHGGSLVVRPLSPRPLTWTRTSGFEPEDDSTLKVFPYPSLRVYLTEGHVGQVRSAGLAGEAKHVGIRMPDSPYEWEELARVTSTAIPADMSLKVSDDGLLLGRLAPADAKIERWDDLESRFAAGTENREDWLRGHLLILDAPGRKMPDRRKRHFELFVPDPLHLPEERPDALRCGPDVVDSFHRLADEIYNKNEKRTAQHPYEPLRQLRSKEGSYRLRPGDLVFFDWTMRDGQPVVTRVALSSIWRKEIYAGATTRDLFARVSPELLPFNRDRRTLSVGEALFGWVRDDDIVSPQPYLDEGSLRAFASRVRFGTARPATPAAGTSEHAPTLARRRLLRLLGSPKPPSPATYLLPDSGGQAHAKAALNERVRPQGRKFYLHGGTDTSPWLPQRPARGAHMHVEAEAIEAGSVFEFDVSFDNLTPFELGLLLYALRPTAAFRHKIGMGKPLGLGTVRVDPGDVHLVNRIARYASDPLNAARSEPLDPADASVLRAVFEESMNGDIRQALRLLGESTRLSRVVYPHVRNQQHDQQFLWFKQNDQGARHHLQPLTEVTPALPRLPVLP